jgi:hypothetical protein
MMPHNSCLTVLFQQSFYHTSVADVLRGRISPDFSKEWVHRGSESAIVLLRRLQAGRAQRALAPSGAVLDELLDQGAEAIGRWRCAGDHHLAGGHVGVGERQLREVVDPEQHRVSRARPDDGADVGSRALAGADSDRRQDQSHTGGPGGRPLTSGSFNLRLIDARSSAWPCAASSLFGKGLRDCPIYR